MSSISTEGHEPNVYKPSADIYRTRCMTVDIITEFAFGSCANLTHESPTSFDAEFLKAFDIGAEVPYKIYYSSMQRLLAKIPLSIAGNFDPALRQLARMIQMATTSHDKYIRRTTESSLPVVFDHLQSVPADLQKAESIDVLIAGSDTSAFTLTTAIYHILSVPGIERKLVESLDEVFVNSATVPSLLQLEQVKYLVSTFSPVGIRTEPHAKIFQRACVNEALRVAMPVPGLLPRVVPKDGKPLVVDGKVVPPGVGSSVIVVLKAPY